MRRILIDRARRRLRARHGGHQERVDVEGAELAAPDSDERLLAVHEALDQLRQHEQVVPSFAARVRVPRIVVEKNQASTSGDNLAP